MSPMSGIFEPHEGNGFDSFSKRRLARTLTGSMRTWPGAGGSESGLQSAAGSVLAGFPMKSAPLFAAASAALVSAGRCGGTQDAGDAKQCQGAQLHVSARGGERAQCTGGDETAQEKAAESEEESGGVCNERSGDERQSGGSLLSACSERYVVLGAMTGVLVDAAHRVEDEHGDLRPCLIARQRDARNGSSERGAANVPRSSFVQRLSDDVIVTSLTGAKLRMLRPQLRVDFQNQLFQDVFHPAIGNGARSRV